MRIIKETDKYVIVRWHEDYDSLNDSKEQKLLCIGGPFDGQMKAGCQIEEAYCQYNRGEYRRKGTPHKAVYIHAAALVSE